MDLFLKGFFLFPSLFFQFQIYSSTHCLSSPQETDVGLEKDNFIVVGSHWGLAAAGGPWGGWGSGLAGCSCGRNLWWISKPASALDVINSHSGASVFDYMNKLRGRERMRPLSSFPRMPQLSEVKGAEKRVYHAGKCVYLCAVGMWLSRTKQSWRRWASAGQ